jgi:hypothetical protein
MPNRGLILYNSTIVEHFSFKKSKANYLEAPYYYSTLLVKRESGRAISPKFLQYSCVICTNPKKDYTII